MRRRLVLLALALGAACQGGPRLRPPALEATLVALELGPGAGRLEVTVPLPLAGGSQVTWELALDGRRFAVGLETAPRAVPGGLTFDAPLAWRHFGWRDGARFLRAEVRGQVTATGEPAGVPYRAAREVLVQGAPVLDSPVE